MSSYELAYSIAQIVLDTLLCIWEKWLWLHECSGFVDIIFQTVESTGEKQMTLVQRGDNVRTTASAHLDSPSQQWHLGHQDSMSSLPRHSQRPFSKQHPNTYATYWPDLCSCASHRTHQLCDCGQVNLFPWISVSATVKGDWKLDTKIETCLLKDTYVNVQPFS